MNLAWVGFHHGRKVVEKAAFRPDTGGMVMTTCAGLFAYCVSLHVCRLLLGCIQYLDAHRAFVPSQQVILVRYYYRRCSALQCRGWEQRCQRQYKNSSGLGLAQLQQLQTLHRQAKAIKVHSCCAATRTDKQKVVAESEEHGWLLSESSYGTALTIDMLGHIYQSNGVYCAGLALGLAAAQVCLAWGQWPIRHRS